MRAQHNTTYRLFCLMGLVVAALFTSGCNFEDKFFTSGLAKDWKGENSISRDALVMNPEYYFKDLDQDLKRVVWLAIPQGKLFQRAKQDYEIRQLQTLLQGYLDLLEAMPEGKDLPEYQLAKIYHDLAADFDNYLHDKQSLANLSMKLASIDTEVDILESHLQEAEGRRLAVLMHTFPLQASVKKQDSDSYSDFQ